MAVHESDVCVIGGGITAVMVMERLAELKPNLKITVVEADRSSIAKTAAPITAARLSTANTPGTTTTSKISRPRA